MNRFKNIITNILGLIFWGLSVYEYFTDKSLSLIIALVILGALLFRYKWNETKVFINKILNRNIEQKILTVDPEIPEKPDERG